MRSVLISIHPKWCEKIANGEKTIEVRKSAPEEVPFKAYIYCTNTPKYHHLYDLRYINKNNSKIKLGCVQHNKDSLVADGYMNGKVIGEFVCDKIEKFDVPYPAWDKSYLKDILEKSCLTYNDLHSYIGSGNSGYGWHISDLKIYDYPIEFSDFSYYCSSATKCKIAHYQKDDFGFYDGWFCGDENTTEEDCPYSDCPSCGGEYDDYEDYAYCRGKGRKPIKRPPQSWCYVEEIKNV